MLQLLVSRVAFMIMVVANEAALFSSSNLELDVRGTNGLGDLHVDHSSDGVAWLIEWVLGLQLDSALGKPASVV